MPAISPTDYYGSYARDGGLFAGGPGILMYHKVAPAPLATNIPALYVHPAIFRRQMQELAASGLPCLSLTQARAAAADGTAGFCLTFDDGFCNVLEHALPVLHQYRLQAIQFIVAGLIGAKDAWDHSIGEPPQTLMDTAQIRSWVDAGQEIGAHTMTHPRLTTLPPAAARAEIFDSKKLLEDRFGLQIRHFCYPYGDCNAQIRAWVAEAGYETAATVVPGVNDAATDPLMLRRSLAYRAEAGPHALAGKVTRAWRRWRSV